MARILVADDDESIRSLLQAWFRRRGHAVDVCADGAAALEALEAEPYDLLISDVVMPLMDGVALARAVRRMARPVPVVLMTGYAGSYGEGVDFASISDAFLTKPFALKDMTEAAERQLARPA